MLQGFCLLAILIINKDGDSTKVKHDISTGKKKEEILLESKLRI